MLRFARRRLEFQIGKSQLGDARAQPQQPAIQAGPGKLRTVGWRFWRRLRPGDPAVGQGKFYDCQLPAQQRRWLPAQLDRGKTGLPPPPKSK